MGKIPQCDALYAQVLASLVSESQVQLHSTLGAGFGLLDDLVRARKTSNVAGLANLRRDREPRAQQQPTGTAEKAPGVHRSLAFLISGARAIYMPLAR